jgi:hypothetical protein
MTRLLGMLVMLLIVVAAIGYFRGWFHAESHSVDGQTTVTVTVDKDKVTQDKDSAQQKVQDLGQK